MDELLSLEEFIGAVTESSWTVKERSHSILKADRTIKANSQCIGAPIPPIFSWQNNIGQPQKQVID